MIGSAFVDLDDFTFGQPQTPNPKLYTQPGTSELSVPEIDHPRRERYFKCWGVKFVLWLVTRSKI